MPPRAASEQRYLDLTGAVLPARARAEGWFPREDHCFRRIVLDHATGGCWYDRVAGRPAYRHLEPTQLEAAVALAERLEREGAPLLAELDAASLAWRGKRPGARRRRGSRAG